MYNKELIEKRVSFIQQHDGTADKRLLSFQVQESFHLERSRSVYFCHDFAIRFSQSQRERMSNTVLSLSALQKYDSIPFIVCIVTPARNYLMLANTTFLTRLSHSSQNFTADNIKGSFNGTDIMPEYQGLSNTPENFKALFELHSEISFQGNLSRLVENTQSINGRIEKLDVTAPMESAIMRSPRRAVEFLHSDDYLDLRGDLDGRVQSAKDAIIKAAQLANVNIRGRVIEYLITCTDPASKAGIIRALENNLPLPQFLTEDRLGDYSKSYPSYDTETDIKTKILFLHGNPKGFNIDKLLKFLSEPKSVYLIYVLGIGSRDIFTRLISVFDDRLISSTHKESHWSGRNTRGTIQFTGEILADILSQPDCPQIDTDLAKQFLRRLIG